jgi:hypothetical protein
MKTDKCGLTTVGFFIFVNKQVCRSLLFIIFCYFVIKKKLIVSILAPMLYTKYIISITQLEQIQRSIALLR